MKLGYIGIKYKSIKLYQQRVIYISHKIIYCNAIKMRTNFSK